MVTSFQNTPVQHIQLLKLRDVVDLTGKSVTSIYTDTDFPRPIKIGSRSSAWVAQEVEEWIKRRIALRDSSCKDGR
jgi:prophage regulatory protein